MKSGFVISLVDPVPAERLDAVVAQLHQSSGGDSSRIRALLIRGGSVARTDSREKAEQTVAMFEAAGVHVQISELAAEFAWDNPRPPAEADQPNSMRSVGVGPRAEARRPAAGNASLAGAAICLLLGGLIAYFLPLLLVLFGPLFIAAFALAIVAIAQGSTFAGIAVLVLSLIVGPWMTIGGLARFITGASSGTPASSAPAPTTSASVATAVSEVDDRETSSVAPNTGGIDGAAYLPHVEIYDFEASYIRTYRGSVPGVRFKVRNTGDKTITRLRLTVYFRDANDAAIFEHRLTPVSDSTFSFDTDVLKPNYIFQMASGRYFTVDNVPNEWQEGNAIIEITSIELE